MQAVRSPEKRIRFEAGIDEKNGHKGNQYTQ